MENLVLHFHSNQIHPLTSPYLPHPTPTSPLHPHRQKSACLTSHMHLKHTTLHSGCQQLTPVTGLMSIAFYCLCIASTRKLLYLTLKFPYFACLCVSGLPAFPLICFLCACFVLCLFHSCHLCLSVCLSAVAVLLSNAAASY